VRVEVDDQDALITAASTVARLAGYLLQAKDDPPRIGTASAL
jgi:hypothetical protein